MFIALFPFSTALLGEYNDQQIAVLVYGINIAIAAFWAYLQWWYAAKDHHLVDADLDPTFITIMSRRSLIGPIIYLIAAALSFVSIYASLVTIQSLLASIGISWHISILLFIFRLIMCDDVILTLI
jgi:uncharacterized membrane protein